MSMSRIETFQQEIFMGHDSKIFLNVSEKHR